MKTLIYDPGTEVVVVVEGKSGMKAKNIYNSCRDWM